MGGFYIRPLEYNKTSLFSSDKPLKTGAFVFMKHFKFRVCIGRIYNPPIRLCGKLWCVNNSAFRIPHSEF